MANDFLKIRLTASKKRSIIIKNVPAGTKDSFWRVNMKKIALLVLVCILAASLVGCFEKYEPKTFTCGKLEIELTDGFEKKSSDAHKGKYLSKNMGVYVDEYQFDDFDDEEAAKEMSEKEFAEKLVEAGDYKTNVELDKGLITFTYEDELGDVDYTFYVVVYKSNEAFWVVTFYTATDSFDDLMDTIRGYARSVDF